MNNKYSWFDRIRCIAVAILAFLFFITILFMPFAIMMVQNERIIELLANEKEVKK